jgi:cation:H+ antiporter
MIELIIQLLIIAVSLVLLASASHFTIKSIETLIELTGLSEASAGFVILAVMTSTPEIVVAVFSVLQGTSAISIGDILGSNLANLTLVLGLVLLTSPFAVDMIIFTEILPFLLITTIFFWRFLTKGGVSQVGGIILIMTYILFQAII